MNHRPSNLAYLLLVLMSVFSMGGPFLIGWVMKGGDRTNWPPDRAIEWYTFIGVTGAVVLLMATILIYGLSLKRQFARAYAESNAKAEANPSDGVPS